MEMKGYHRPVMEREAIDLLTSGGNRGGVFVDATLGGGGHAEALLRSRADICAAGLDQDPEAIQAASTRLARFGNRFRAVHLNFRRIRDEFEADSLDGVLMDLGASSHQFDTPERGFSFQRDGPLDMRMDPQSARTAAEVVNSWKEEDLAKVFWEWGEERHSRRIARAVAEARRHHALRTTAELADLVARAVPKGRSGRIHPATRVFQALRLAVNDELEALREGLQGAWDCLKGEGRLAVISFHSLEDRMVKLQFRQWAREDGTGDILTKKPIEASEEEVRENPRGRSAKLRAIRKKSPEREAWSAE